MGMTRRQNRITRKLETVFERPQAAVLGEVITDAYSDLVKTGDFNELKAIVRDLALAQNRTEQRMEELAEAQQRTEQRVEELAEAQQRTEQRMEELAEAQQRTEQRVEELAEAQKELAEAQQRTEQRMEELAEAQQRTEQRMEELAEAQKNTQLEIQTLSKRLGDLGATVGGLGNTLGYALENEAYRMLPGLLKEKYGLEITERFIRTDVGGQEINILGRARQNGRELLIVGETKSRLDRPRRKKQRKGKGWSKDIWEQLAEKVTAVQAAHPDVEIVPLIVTHYARPAVVEQAAKDGIIIVQSFEW